MGSDMKFRGPSQVTVSLSMCIMLSTIKARTDVLDTHSSLIVI